MSEELRKRAVEYLLGEMDHADAERFAAELGSDAGLRRIVDEMQPVVNRLEALPPDSWEELEPPPLVVPDSVAATGSARPVERTAEKAPGFASRLRWPRVAMGFAAACLIFAVGIFTGTRFEDSGPSGPPATETLALASLGEAPSEATGQVKLASSSEDPVTLDVSGLPPTGPGEFYELWLLGKDDELVALGSFRVKPDGVSEVQVPLPVNPSDYKYFDVSIQPENGSPDHSGRSVLRGLSTS